MKKHVDLHEANVNTTSKLSSLLIKMQSAEYMPRSLRLGISLQVPAQFQDTHPDDVTDMETSISNATIAFQAACKEVFVKSITKQLSASKLAAATLYQEFLLDVLNHLKPVYDIFAARNVSTLMASHFASFDTLAAYIKATWKPNTPRPLLSPASTSRFPFLFDLATLSDRYEEDLLAFQLNKAFKLETEQRHQREILQTAAKAMEVESSTPTVQSVNALIDQKLSGINKKLKSLSKNLGQPSSALKTNSKTKASSTASQAQRTRKPASHLKSKKQNDKVGNNTAGFAKKTKRKGSNLPAPAQMRTKFQKTCAKRN